MNEDEDPQQHGGVEDVVEYLGADEEGAGPVAETEAYHLHKG